MRLFALLFALLAVAAAANAADVPDISKPVYAIVAARFTPKEALPNPSGPDVYLGVDVKGEVAVSSVLAGRLTQTHFTAELWLPKMSGALDVYLLLEKVWEGGPQIAAWSPAREGFCIAPEQALDGPVDDVIRLRKLHPCKR